MTRNRGNEPFGGGRGAHHSKAVSTQRANAPEAPPREHPGPLFRVLRALPVATAAAFSVLALATIPYGAPMPDWYMAMVIASAAGLLSSLALDPSRRWRSLVWWPVPAILGAWAASIVACNFPIEVAQRSWGMALYSILFVACQVLCWGKRGLKCLVLVVLATVLIMAVDLWWQHRTHRSLVREIRAPVIGTIYGSIHNLGWSQTTGSLRNTNDQAVVAVLLPICGAVMANAWAWGLIAIALIPAGYLALVGKSRQLLLGLCAGVASQFIGHAPRRARWWIGIAVAVAAVVVALTEPSIRARFADLREDPLGDRGMPIAYGLALFLAHPVFGTGPSLYGHYYTLGVRQGWTLAGEPLPPVGMPWVHCLPLEVACETGAIGLLAFGTVLWVFVRRIRRACSVGGPARNLGLAVAASAVSMAAIGLIDLAFIKDWVRICWWLVLGLGFAAPTLPGAQDKPKPATLSNSIGL